MKHIIVIYSLLMFLSSLSFSQSDKAKECLKKIKEYTVQKNSMDLPADDEYYYLKNKVQISFWEDLDMPDLTENVEIIAGNKQLHYITDDIEMHQDNNDLILIVNKTKSIIRTYPRTDFNNKGVKEKMQLIDNAFFNMIENMTYEEYLSQDKTIQKLDLKMNKKAQDIYNVKNVICHYDSGKQKLAKVELFYNKNYQYKKMTIWYFDENYDYKASLKNKAIYYALDKKGRLLSKFNDYEFTNDKDL